MATYFVVLHFANQAYDHELEDTVLTVVGQLKRDGDPYSIELSAAGRQMLEFDEFDKVYFSVSDPSGNVLVGNHDLPRYSTDLAHSMRLYDVNIDGQPARLAEYAVFSSDRTHERVLVQVAETTHKRAIMAREALLSMIVPQLAFIFSLACFVWFGVGRGIAPLNRISDALTLRSPEDLKPIDASGLPSEVHKQVTVINDLMSRLGQIIEAQRRFLADATHQLRTPITVVRTQAELAARIEEPHQLKSIIAEMNGSTARLSRLANQLLSLSRAEAGLDQLLVTEHVDLRLVIQEAIAALVSFVIEKNINISFVDKCASIEVRGDSQLLGEMLVNIIDNAVRYTPGGGTVRVSAEMHNGDAMISVADTGPGIPAEERTKVLERFYRGKTSNVEGTGLGLAIAQEIVSQHSGRLSLDSAAAGSGLIVTVAIPTQKTSDGFSPDNTRPL